MSRKLKIGGRHIVKVTLTRGPDSAVDTLVGAATTEMPCHCGGDRFARGRGGSVLITPLIEKIDGLDDEPRRAEATL